MNPLNREDLCILPVSHPARAWVSADHTDIAARFGATKEDKPVKDLNPVFLSMLVTDRWNEAVKKNDCRTWRACWQLAELEAAVIERHEPDNVLVAALTGIANDAHARYLSLMPKNA